MNDAGWRTIGALMGLLAGIGGCGEGLTENSAINPSDVNDTTLASNVNDTTLDNDSGDEPVPSPCLLAEPKDLNFAAKLCNWTWTEVLTLRSCGETPVTIVDVGLETGENLACVGYHCEYYVVDGVSPMTLGPYETMEVLVHYSPAKVFDLDEQGQALPDRATVLVLFDGGELAVPVIGIGVSAPCASPHVTMYSQDMEIADGDTVAVGTTLSFVATPTCDDAPANAWEWFLDPPEGATATFVPSSTAENPTLTVTSPGEYAVSSVVSDKDDGGSCAPTTVTFWVDGSL